MSYFYDIILIILVLAYFIEGKRKGFTRSVVGLVGGIISILLASFLSNYISEWVFDTFMRQNITNEVSGVLQDTIGQDINTRSQAILAIFPPFVSNIFSYYGVTAQSINVGIFTASQSATTQVVNIIAPIIIDLMRKLSFVIISFLLLFMVRSLTRPVIRLVRIPIIKQIDGLLGGILGLAKCALIVFIFSFIIYFITPLMATVPEAIKSETINSTYIFKYVYYNNPLNTMLNTVNITDLLNF